MILVVCLCIALAACLPLDLLNKVASVHQCIAYPGQFSNIFFDETVLNTLLLDESVDRIDLICLPGMGTTAVTLQYDHPSDASPTVMDMSLGATDTWLNVKVKVKADPLPAMITLTAKGYINRIYRIAITRVAESWTLELEGKFPQDVGPKLVGQVFQEQTRLHWISRHPDWYIPDIADTVSLAATTSPVVFAPIMEFKGWAEGNCSTLMDLTGRGEARYRVFWSKGCPSFHMEKLVGGCAVLIRRNVTPDMACVFVINARPNITLPQVKGQPVSDDITLRWLQRKSENEHMEAPKVARVCPSTKVASCQVLKQNSSCPDSFCLYQTYKSTINLQFFVAGSTVMLLKSSHSLEPDSPMFTVPVSIRRQAPPPRALSNSGDSFLIPAFKPDVLDYSLCGRGDAVSTKAIRGSFLALDDHRFKANINIDNSNENECMDGDNEPSSYTVSVDRETDCGKWCNLYGEKLGGYVLDGRPESCLVKQSGAIGGDISNLHKLLPLYKVCINVMYEGETPLIAAVHTGNVAVAELLIEMGADKDRRANHGVGQVVMPLCYAAERGHIPMSDYLMSISAGCFKKNSGIKMAAIDLAVKYGHVSLADHLIARDSSMILEDRTREKLNALRSPGLQKGPKHLWEILRNKTEAMET